MKDFLHQRLEVYNDVPEANMGVLRTDSDDSDNGIENEEEFEMPTPAATGLDWRKFVLIKGKPGAGKSHALKVAIKESLEDKYTVCCAMPTGILTSQYRSQFFEDNFCADTIHSLFKYPVSSLEKLQVNWDLARYDVLIVDELSMVPVKIFDHVRNSLNELHVRPVVILCGNEQQQQPIEMVEGRTRQMSGVLYSKRFYGECITVNFLEQVRCKDPLYQEYLNTIRYFKPTSSFLHK